MRGEKAVFDVWELDLAFTAWSRCYGKQIGRLHSRPKNISVLLSDMTSQNVPSSQVTVPPLAE